MKKEDLTAPDLMVMEALTASRTTPSTVTLAADLWDPKQNPLGADPVGFVQWVLDSLCERGLVTMRIHQQRTTGMSLDEELKGRNPYEKFAFQIRLTTLGWELMGFPTVHAQVFTRLSTAQNEPTTGDRTRFRTHRSSSEGGAIEVDTFADHQVLFPQHIHDYAMAGDDMATRRYLRMTDEIEQEIRAYAAAHPDKTHVEIADDLAYSDRTIKYVLTDLPRIRRQTGDTATNGASQKQRIVWALQMADHENVTSLRKTLGRTDTSHDIVHALHDLKTEGKVDFQEKAGRDEPIRIHLTDRGHAFADKMTVEVVTGPRGLAEAINHARESNGQTPFEIADTGLFVEPIEKSVPSATYPELDRLLEQEKQRLDKDNKAMKYIEAAELIRDTDPETAALLEAKAAENDVPYPSPVEAEYLRYVSRNS